MKQFITNKFLQLAYSLKQLSVSLVSLFIPSGLVSPEMIKKTIMSEFLDLAIADSFSNSQIMNLFVVRMILQ
jgi:hypothetical protein